MSVNDRKTWLVAYDIRCPRRLRKVHQRLKREGASVQYSAYAVVASDCEIRCLLQQIESLIDARADEVRRARSAARRDIKRMLTVETERVSHLTARLTTLGPAATLARGYAVVQTMPDTHVLRTTADAPAGMHLRIRVADGAITAVSEGTDEAH